MSYTAPSSPGEAQAARFYATADEIIVIEYNTVPGQDARRAHHVAHLTNQPTPRASNGPQDGPLVAEIIHGAT